MNTYLFDIIKQIVATHGEHILDNPQKLKPLFKAYAQGVSKEDRVAFGRAIENGFYVELKHSLPANRAHIKTTLVPRLQIITGYDVGCCSAAIDLLEAVIFPSAQSGQPPQLFCNNCGTQLQGGSLFCSSCGYKVGNQPGTGTQTGPSGYVPPKMKRPAFNVLAPAGGLAALILVVVLMVTTFAGNQGERLEAANWVEPARHIPIQVERNPHDRIVSQTTPPRQHLSRVTESNLIGVWELESAENISRSELVNRVVLFNNGTGIADLVRISWQLKDGNRLQINWGGLGAPPLRTNVYDIDMAENATLLTIHNRGRNHPQRGIYRKAVFTHVQPEIGARVTEISHGAGGWTYIHYEVINFSHRADWIDLVITYTDTAGRRQEINSHMAILGGGTIAARTVQSRWQGVQNFGGNATVQAFFRN